jgi:DNA polymerase V
VLKIFSLSYLLIIHHFCQTHIDPINDLTNNGFIAYKEQNKNIMKLTIPFYLHKVGAGFPSPATDYIEDDIDLNTHLITNAPATFIIRVQGKSMVNVGIYDGDLLIVDKSIDPRNFSTVIANVNEELVVKTLIKEKRASYLTSGSKNILDKFNLAENPEIIVWGVVTYVIHKQQ